MSLQLDTLLRIWAGLLPVGVFIAISVVAITKRDAPQTVRRRVAIGAILCALSLVVSYALRVNMTQTVPAVRFATLVPVLNLGETLVSMTGILLMVSAAFIRREDSEPTGSEPTEHTETGNPYEPI